MELDAFSTPICNKKKCGLKVWSMKDTQ
jgi:hypothetical protein